MERVKSKPPIERFRGLLQFLNGIKEDPTDCVSTAAIDQIRNAERHFLALEIRGKRLEPDWVFHCNEVDKHSAWCSGNELDTSAQLPEENFGAHASRTPPARSLSATLVVPEGYACHLIGIYGTSSTALQAGKPATPLAHTEMTIKTAQLPTKSPVLIVTLRCEDKLRYRKAVWHLY
jgi:hypothetical protein